MKNIFKILFILLVISGLSACREEQVEKAETGFLKGKVVKRGSNEPVSNAKITTAPTSTTVFTDTDGSFEITDIPLGDYSVKAELSGFLANYQAANLQNPGQVVTIVFEMEDDESLNTAPSQPELISPVDNAENQPLSVELTWKSTDPDEDDVLVYSLIVKNDQNTDVVEVADLKEAAYTLKDLKFGVSYFWQVSVTDGIHDAVLSPVYKFTTSKTPNNRYHFVRKENGNYFIISSDESGSNSFRFTDTSFNSWRPRKNNNAGLIAFLRTEGGSPHIFTAKPDGSEVFKVTSIPLGGFNNIELDYSWSTNGKEFLYANFDKLYRINKDGSGQQLVYSTPDGSMITEVDWSYDNSKIAVKTNDYNGYKVKIYVIDMLGNVLNTVLADTAGAAGGLNFSVDGKQLLFTHDVSGYQDSNYRQLNSHIFIYTLADNTIRDISDESDKPNGTNDLDPRFSPNNAQVIFTNTSNDGISQKNILSIDLNTTDEELTRTTLFENAEMPDYE
ncbi:carboxypeptidase regulatory-like domain-containing protein [Daejeonia sp. YH14]|uniref:carboxypeptidase regulatory-like domain-containing protein n=1 Tax=Daejeonia sp. YH14 TaxID=3439042 RepID=UPI003F49A10B